METFNALMETLNGFVWGPPMMVLLLGVGFFLTVGLRFLSILRVGYGFKQLFKKRTGEAHEGDVSPFAALMTALSSTVGTGNIAGVAAAIAIGGPGAVFWMWMTAILGTATKFAEGVLSVRFREIDANGNRVGGPMYYIKNGLGPKFIGLAFAFALFGIIGALSTGNAVQANSIADALQSQYNFDPRIVAVVLALLVGGVVFGGIKRIGAVASRLVPLMALLYISAALIVIAANIGNVPAAFGMIFKGAFGMQEAGTGITIGLMMLAMQKGIARGLFSNEAGQGSAPIAHAAAQNNDPVNQGIIAMLGTIIDTLIICTITALVILTSGVMTPDCLANPAILEMLKSGSTPMGCEIGVPLTAQAFDAVLVGFGGHIVTICLAIFAFTTIIGWSYYGERCTAFIFKEKSIPIFRAFWVLAVFASTYAMSFETDGDNMVVATFWLIADSLTGLMAAPNLIALIFLSPIVFKMAKEYFDKEKIATDGLIDQDDLK
ncbi:AGCS family alanine or glycine:cation symporter [Litorimonas taeanensis]|uniref:AGCS family alanine or glycine:cation symporter n=1 Tax=Litorimonas taeanensis TaxID=568099 RepID=A0A420WDI5_9PROT|nr:sodium:alanine symporter family protein [Litorimonas taeanensis]RKQ69056.1 AGCS family alanine or glycine:cation symporter [Litorimonas taeanensis]